MAALATPTTNPKCHILELAAELRNTIYRYTLCVDEEMRITSESFQQPALLRTCRQIRQEASPIYYHENEIGIDTVDYDATALISFWQHAGHHLPFDKPNKCAVYVGHDCTSWTNLVEWVKAFWDGKVTYMAQCSDDSEAWVAGVGAFAIAIKVKAMKGTRADVEDLLQIHKSTTALLIEWRDAEEEPGESEGSEAEDEV